MPGCTCRGRERPLRGTGGRIPVKSAVLGGRKRKPALANVSLVLALLLAGAIGFYLSPVITPTR